MIWCGLVIVFFVTVLTGPAGVEVVQRRKQLKDKPLAKVLPFPYKGKHPWKL